MTRGEFSLRIDHSPSFDRVSRGPEVLGEGVGRRHLCRLITSRHRLVDRLRWVDLSIVLPAFDERDRIAPTLKQIEVYQALSTQAVEVIVVDDGSSDGTADYVESWRDRIDHLLVIRQPANLGKGRAVATGMLTARGAYRAFFDADASTPIEEVDKLLTAAQTGPRRVAIGSLGKYGNRKLREPQPWTRTALGRLGNGFIRSTVLPGVHDSQRGCKLWPAELADRVFAMQRLSGWGFDIEVLALSQRLGYEVVEVPVEWHHVRGGHIGPTAYLSTLREVLRLRRMFAADVYGLERGFHAKPLNASDPTPVA